MKLCLNADAMQSYHEASIKSLQNKCYPCTPQYNGTYFEGFQEFEGGLHAQPGWNLTDPDCSLSSKTLESSEDYMQRPVYHHDYGTWSPNLDPGNAPQRQLKVFQGHFHPFAVNHRLQCAPVNMFPQTYPYDYQFQDFQYFVVIDFEATCDKEKAPQPQEIIEFPSVIVSSITGQLEACFQTYVRPTCNQHLSDFCKDLTGIQQIQVDRGVTLSEALLRHDKWLEKKGIKDANFAVVTWSDWDCRVMLESECRYKNIRKPPYFNRWINLRVPFHEVFGEARCNLREAVEKAGLAWEGRAHCGLDDAKNTARLLALIMHKGFKFSITNSLTFQSSNDSMKWKPTPEKPLFVPPQSQKLDDPQPQVFQYLPFCYCGVKSSKGVIRKPGPKHGSTFFGCGNWTAARGALCQYFKWASP
ncbi:UNVERIFIED_CONTAM: ERI1 exoribonuclease 2 [Sesamum latifolium]|uniref:ERI1 exoribonuclease 2 n=1 Tax=Sesamum latifolium TaxID=2727402 RepID=A0AAW2XPF7_9LAMI